MIRTILTAAALLLAAQPVLAEGDIGIKEGKAFKHKKSKAQFPGKIADLKLTRVHDFSAGQFDVAGIYGGFAGGDEISVYIYRAPIPDVSLWAGQVAKAVEYRAAMHAADPADAVPHFFTPPGARNASAMRMTFKTVPGEVASTGVALVPYGEWLLKIRVSSTHRTPQEVDAMIDAALAAFPLPDEAKSAPAAYLPQTCGDTLDAAPANLAEAGGDPEVGATVLAVMVTSIHIPEAELAKRDGYKPSAAITWCRDPVQLGELGIYRPNGSKAGYIVSLSDSGQALSVGNWLGRMGQVAEEMSTLKVPVTSLNAAETRIIALYDRVPPPEQAYGAIKRGRMFGATDRVTSIQINSDALKPQAPAS